ncbi:precorrin-2 C(20)-methyltransferase [Tistrella sp. BH-R2-4]|uniref:Precorrin-2 C(20)-methyltransferase n=1 Tax=Tistrella arctica TaxID=3133430 RepID=A0ABU9YM92_9PROT
MAAGIGDAAAGRLIGLGMGPGDPELITLKAARLLASLPVIAHIHAETPEAGAAGPASGGEAGLARGIAGDLIRADATLIAIAMPMREDRAAGAAAYDAGAARIAGHLAEGHDVGVLCEGDPLTFGSFMYLAARLSGRFRIEVVPGITSMTAAAARLVLPLAARTDSLAIIPATLPEAELARRLDAADGAAFLKIGRHLAKLRRVLTAAGLADHAWYVEHATRPEERILKLSMLADDTAPYFSLILVHRRGEATR